VINGMPDALGGFVVAGTVMPGPNNFMVLASGAVKSAHTIPLRCPRN
jgi:hypothetical protein